MTNSFDVLIIGGGVAGLSAACFLSAHRNVAVLEAESQPAYHSSGRSAAVFIEGYENPVVAALTSASAPFFNNPPQGFSEHALLHPRGGLTVSTHGQDAAFQAHLDTWRPLCPQLREIDVAEATAMVPILRREWLHRIAYDPAWRSIDVHALIMGYRAGLKANGGSLYCDHRVQNIDWREGRWQLDAGQSFEAPLLINAAGSWAGQIGAMVGCPLEVLQPMRRTAAIVAAPEGAADWPLVHDTVGELYFKPESPGLMVSPADEIPSEPMDAYPHDIDIALAMERFAQMTTHAVTRVHHQWAGLRTFATDRRPVVGFDPRQTNFFWLAGQGGFGVQTSPALGQLVTRAVVQSEAIDNTIAPDRLLS